MSKPMKQATILPTILMPTYKNACGRLFRFISVQKSMTNVEKVVKPPRIPAHKKAVQELLCMTIQPNKKEPMILIIVMTDG